MLAPFSHGRLGGIFPGRRQGQCKFCNIGSRLQTVLRCGKHEVEGIRLAVDAVANGMLDPSPLYTHSYHLDQLDQAFDMMKNRPDGFLKALVLV